MKSLTWPQAFVLVFGALPAFMFAVAVIGVYPMTGVPLVLGSLSVYGLHRRARRRDALALRADADYAANLALVAAPIDLPTEPMRRRAS
jgi:hypothetical protein